jgi:hypothetical protein
VVHDVDPSLFASANVDLLGGSAISQSHRVFVVGKRRAETALNNKRYSRALQANTPHFYRVTCGSDVATGQFSTVNPPLGNSYPELPSFDPTAFGNVADPTIDWSDRSQIYIDPLTGIAIKRMTAPGDAGYVIPNNAFDFAYDPTNSWSNPSGALGKGGSATTAKANAPLFLSWNEMRTFQLTWSGANFNPFSGTVDDLLLRLNGSGGTFSACISLDSGQTCASSVQTITMPSGSGAAAPAPASFPSPIFGGWGRAFSTWEISNKSAPNGASANAGSNVVTAGGGSFNVDWASGVKIKITGSGCNGNDVCTIASVQSSSKLTTVETIPNQVANQAWQAYPAGIRLSLTAGAQASVSATYDFAESYQYSMGDNTNQIYCSLLQVSDVYKDSNGNPLSSPLTGRLCNFGFSLYLFIDKTGEFRLLSNYFMNSNSPLPGSTVYLPTNGAFSTTNPKVFYGIINGQSGLFQGAYTGDYTPYKAGGSTTYITSKPVADAVTWTNVAVSGSATDPAVEFANNPSTQSYYSSGFFNPPAFQSLLNGYGEYMISPFSGSDKVCAVARYNLSTHSISQILDSWSTWPLRWGSCHFAPNGGGSFQFGVFNPIRNLNANAPLGGPFQLNVKQVMKGGAWNNNTALTESSIVAASNTTPVVVTTMSTTTDLGYRAANDHGLIDREPVTIWGAPSNTVINTSNAPYFVKASYGNSSLAAAMGTSDTAFSVSDGSRFTSNPMFKIDTEYIRCSAQSGNTLSGCVRASEGTTPSAHAAGATVVQANSFALYQDAALTNPVAGNGTLGDNGSTYVMDLDVCPALTDSRWTSNMIYDSTGAVGRRCNTIKVAGEPFSQYAYWSQFGIGSGLASITVAGGTSTVKLTAPFNGWQSGQQIVINGANLSTLNGTFTISSIVDSLTATVATPGVSVSGTHTEPSLVVKHPTEHYLFPYGGDPSNLNLSSLQALQEGDFLNDLGAIPYAEQMVVVKKVVNAPNDIDLTIMRYWGDLYNCDNHNRLSGAQVHKNGWVPYMVVSYGCQDTLGYADVTDSAWRIGDGRLTLQHYDIAPGSGSGQFTYVAGGGITAAVNLSFSQIMTQAPQVGVVNEYPTFGGSSASLSSVNTLQTYPAFRQVTAQPSEKVWKSDFHALNTAYGAAQDNPVGLTSGMNMNLIRGTQYDSASQTSTVYKITNLPSGIDRKRLPLMGFAGYHYLTDMSAPGSVISDTTKYRICVADIAGECRPNSGAGDIFATIPGADFLNNGWCFTNTYEYNIPCIFSANPMGGWGIQEQIAPPDTNATKGRRLSMGFVNPGRHFTFSNWVPSPDASWGFLSPPFINGIRNDIFAMKLPPWPAADTINRADFVPLTVNVTALPGASTARAVFGYAENGPPDHFYCTTRQETCTTSGTPFAWLSEPQQLQQCHAGCTIHIPAIAGRVVYYRLDWMDAAGRVLSSSAINAAAATP